jgi:hypothetical protein
MTESNSQPEPAVTAIVAAYRAGDYLREAIASALAQTWTDLEVLVSDDAADPAVRQLAESFNDSRVRYRANPVRLGVAGNHWAGFAAARGRYLAILNHDDLWRPDFLMVLVAALESEPDVVVAFCDHDLIDAKSYVLTAKTDENSQRWGRSGLSPGRHCPFRDLVIRQTLPIAMGAVFRRDVIAPAALPDVGPSYDLWLAYLLARAGGAAWYANRRLTGWRVHPDQLTGQTDLAWAGGAVACWQAMDQDPGFRAFRRPVRVTLSQSATGAAKAALIVGNARQAAQYARLALRAKPTNPRAWIFGMLCFLPGRLRRLIISRANRVPGGAKS